MADALGLEHAVCQQHGVPNKLTLLVDIVAQLEKLRASGRLDAAGQQKMAQARADGQELEDLLLWRVVTLTAYLRDAHDQQALIEALAA